MNKIICFSGLDGSGKSTQSLLFYRYLCNQKINSKLYHTKNIIYNKKIIIKNILDFIKKRFKIR